MNNFCFRPLALWGLITLFCTMQAYCQERRAFVEHTGGDTVRLLFSVWRDADGWRLLSTGTHGETHDIRLAQDYNTDSWHYVAPGRKIDYVATRDGDTVHVVGVLNGKPVDRTLSIPDFPWYQALEKSLEPFIHNSGSDSVRFWMIEPFGLTAEKMVADKQGEETVTLEDGSTVRAYRVYVTFEGFRSLFWHANYWYRVTDGQFVKFEGARGGPGTPITRVTEAR